MAPPGAPKRPLEGLVWPLVPNSDKDGDRSTTYANKGALAAAAQPLDPELAKQIIAEKKWRQKYVKYFNKLVAAQLKSEDAAVKSSEAGLAWLYDNFEFVKDGKTMKLGQAMSSIKDSFLTGTVKGSKPKSSAPLQVPYKGQMLSGDALKAQVNKWVKYGTIEPSAGQAILDVADKKQWRDLSDKYFVLLGAGSAMGPLHLLLELGANIIAIDLDRPGIWKRLIGLAQKSSGTMIFPIKGSKSQSELTGDSLYDAAGCNLLTQAPQILNWLKTVETGKPLIVGAYAYLDGELHVRVSLAMDAIIKGLLESRGADVMPCYLCTPTDIHVIPEEAYLASKKNFNSLSLVNLLLKLSPFYWMGSLVKNPKRPIKADNGDEFYVVDGMVNRQGPNYALAKRIQHWRAVVGRQKSKCKVSSNIAPSTATASVTSNKLFAMAYGGMHFFKPFEVFQQETSNAVMGALLLRDIHDPNTPTFPDKKLRNPLELFSYGSFHGGVWRCGYTIDSIGSASIAAFILSKLLLAGEGLFVVALVVVGVLFALGHDPLSIGGYIGAVKGLLKDRGEKDL